MPPVLAKNNTPPLRSEQQLLDILEQYAEKIVITFMPPGMPDEMAATYGITSNVEDPNLGGACNGYDFVITMLNPGLILPLLDQNESATSKAQAALILAVTLAHEMVHIIYRIKNLLAPQDEIHRDEPFYAPPGILPEKSAWISELGISWEQTIIGGTLSECPRKRGRVGARGGGLFTFTAEAPNWNVWRTYNVGVDAARHEDDSWNGYALPASFVTQLYCSDEFWRTQFAKYGLPALRVPRLLRTEMDRKGVGEPEICELEYAVPEFRPQLEELGERFKTRESQWRRLRPWFNDKETEWDETPYSRVWLRNLAGRFRTAHRTGDEWTAQKCYTYLGVSEQWGERFATQGFLLDQDDDWIDQAVGYLMMLIMPIRTHIEKRKIPWFPRNEHTPSVAAVVDAAARSVRPFEVELAGSSDWEESQLAPRNVPFTPYDPQRLMGNRGTLIIILRDEIPNRQRLYPVPDPIFQELKAMFNNVDREAPKYQLPGQWLSDQIKFVLPPWQTEQAKTKIGYSPVSLYEPYNHAAQPQQHVPGGSDPGTPRPRTPPLRPKTAPPETPDSDSSSSSDYLTPPSRSLGTPRRSSSAHSARRRVAHSAGRAAVTVDEDYYTVGEFGNHRSTGDLWIIADDGACGYDVYDATDVVEEIWADDPKGFSLDEHCEVTLLGLKARPDLQQSLEEQAERMGKLILPMRRHEIAERDGRHGKPFWISVGNDAFDITNFPFESRRQRELMRKYPGGNPWKAIVTDGTIDCDQLVVDLKPYRCAVVASQTPEKGPDHADEFHFTRQEVACHIYPEATMYTIIRGQVYDLTGYMEFHPGGEAVLRQWAGRDSTREFERFHADANRCLKDYDYLRVGRLVEERSLHQLTHNEVALNGHVYDLSRIDSQKPVPQFLREIDRLGLRGSDITSVLNDGFRLPPEALLLLPQRPDLITAKLSAPLAEIDLATLRANNGSHIPLPEGMNIPRNRVEADLKMPLWVSCDGLVYDMTAVSKWGPEDVKTLLNGHDHRYRGAVIPPSTLATRLQQDYSCRVIGRLVRKSGRPRDEESSSSDDLDSRPRQKPRLQ